MILLLFLLVVVVVPQLQNAIGVSANTIKLGRFQEVRRKVRSQGSGEGFAQVLEKVPQKWHSKEALLTVGGNQPHQILPNPTRHEFLDHRLFVVGSINIETMGATLGIKVGVSWILFHLFDSHTGYIYIYIYRV